MTNARDQVAISVDPRNKAVASFVASLADITTYTVTEETDDAFEARVATENPWNVVPIGPTTEYPLVGHFVSLLFPLGHIKSVKSDDKAFADHFATSPKWLKAV